MPKQPGGAAPLTRRFLWMLALGVALLLGCSITPQPDLERIYQRVSSQPKKAPLIFIPGILGSRLVDVSTGNPVWPRSLLSVALGRNLDLLALPVEGVESGLPLPSLRPDGLFLSIAGESFYRDMVHTLERIGGYDCVGPDRIRGDTDCVLFAWDWRRDMVDAAARLDALVERLRALRADPDLKVDLVAHSAGGLVARYFLRFGGEDVLDRDEAEIAHRGGYKVRKAILVGTPNYGSISALQESITGMPVGLGHLSPETLATMPVQAQLLPHPDRSWMVDIRGDRIDLELFDVETWRENRWSIFDPRARKRIASRFESPASAEAYLSGLETVFERSLRRGARFHRALSEPRQDSPHKMIVFGGDCHMTPARCLLEQVDGESRVHLHPRQILDPIEGIDYERLMLEPGDGKVTKSSLLARDSLDPTEGESGDFRIDYEFFVCEKHSRLAENVTFRDNLLNILLD